MQISSRGKSDLCCHFGALNLWNRRLCGWLRQLYEASRCCSVTREKGCEMKRTRFDAQREDFHIIRCLRFLTEVWCVFCEVGTELLNVIYWAIR